MPNLLEIAGRAPYMMDSTRGWVENFRKNGLLKPQVILRIATDTNHIRNVNVGGSIYSPPRPPGQWIETKAVMNNALPGMRIPGILNWTVNEAIDTITQTASFECLNCLPISERQGTLQFGIPARYHTDAITATYIGNSLGVTEKINGNTNPETQTDVDGYHFREERLKYRTFAHETFTIDLANAEHFPKPEIPNDDDNDIPDASDFPKADQGSGSYFVLINNEVMRVIAKSGAVFSVPAGGRAVNGVLQEHAPGSIVKLLGFAPYTNEWTGLGYLNVDDFAPQTAILRPGTCMVSYEGYGDIQAQDLGGGKFGLSHKYNPYSNYTFTGYWFVSSIEPSVTEDGVPRVKVDLKGVGNMFEQQKISQDILRKMKNKYGQWRLGRNSNIFAAADHDRDIPGDWVDYNSWESSLPGSYPLQIKTEFAQHKEFFDHMQETEFGTKCEICRQEHAEWLKTHKAGGTNKYIEDRAVGKHIYKQSIRVMGEDGGGPIATYIRLMAAMSAAAWDHPAHSTELAHRFTKVPNRLFDNIRNISTGLVYNGQIHLDLESGDKEHDWFTPSYSDNDVIAERVELTCPFESTYDSVPFSQPMIDLSEANGCFFTVNREGYPVFKPRLFSTRPETDKGFRDLQKTIPYLPESNEWFASYGASISGYTPSLNPESALTQCWITATTAFDTELTVLTAGAGYRGGANTGGGNQKVLYAALGGNKEALALTSGVQQVETITFENQTLGMDWNTKAGWGVKVEDTSGDVIVAGKPALYDGSPIRKKGQTGEAVKRIQRTVNFFLVRTYIKPLGTGGKILKITVDGKFGSETELGVKAIQALVSVSNDGIYGRATYLGIKQWMDTHEHFIKFDVFWYVAQRKSWEEYVAAVTGVPIPVKNTSVKGKDGEPEFQDYTPQQKLLNENREDWTKTFSRVVVNVGIRRIDEELDKATARSITSNIADPRIMPGDVIWCEVPGYLGSRSPRGDMTPPFTNGIYVQQVTRQMDLTTGSYTASYSGHRFRGNFNQGLTTRAIGKGYDFI